MFILPMKARQNLRKMSQILFGHSFGVDFRLLRILHSIRSRLRSSESEHVYIYYPFINSTVVRPTTGCIGEILPQVGLVWYASISLPMLGSILCYCLIGAIVRFNKNGWH